MQSDRLVGWALVVSACAFALSVVAQKPTQLLPGYLPPAQAAKEGRELAAEILSEKPAQNATNTGVMTMRDSKGRRTRVPVRFDVFDSGENWVTIYSAGSTKANYGSIKVVRTADQPNQYFANVSLPPGSSGRIPESQLMAPFAPGSDFWIADLGLEFFHWPEQMLIKKEMKRSCSCNVLESINPRPAPGAYSRVVSWLDIDSTNGIVYAEAYDLQGKKLKQFIPKKISHGQLAEMEIDNLQTDSRTTVDFDVDKSR